MNLPCEMKKSRLFCLVSLLGLGLIVILWVSQIGLVRVKVSSLPTDDLIVVDQVKHQIHILADLGLQTSDLRPQSSPLRPSSSVLSTLDTEGAPAAVLPMRLNVDALDDLVILKSGSSVPAVALTAPLAAFVVNSNGDAGDGNLMDGICATPPCVNVGGVLVCSGPCTLRAAIQQANASGSPSMITFAPGITSITPGPVYDRINVPMTMDGTSNGRVELNGNSAFGGDRIFDPIALSIRGGNSTIRGMAIHNFGTAIEIVNPGAANTAINNIIENNFIGTDVTGTTVPAGRQQTWSVLDFTSNNLIGGTTTAARNVISGNFNGVLLAGPGAHDNKVQGNYVGVDIAGTHALGNTLNAVECSDSMNNLIGGTTAGAGNVLSASTSTSPGLDTGGVAIPTRNSPADGNMVQGNFIGTDASGRQALGNGGSGVVSGLGTDGTMILNNIARALSLTIDDLADTFAVLVRAFNSRLCSIRYQIN